MLLDRLSGELGLDPTRVGVVVVDHGSRRAESNDLLLEVVAMFRRVSGLPIVEPAHMELADPTIAAAFDACVAQGATTVVVFPYFLSPGRHWSLDIPALSQAAAKRRPGVRLIVTSPLGLHDLMGQVMQERIAACLAHSGGDGTACDLCRDGGGCAVGR